MNKKLRAVVVLRSDESCEVCMKFVGADGHAHHLFGRGKVKEDESNVIYLCPNCHEDAHQARPDMVTVWRRLAAWSSINGYRETTAACVERVERLTAKGF